MVSKRKTKFSIWGIWDRHDIHDGIDDSAKVRKTKYVFDMIFHAAWALHEIRELFGD